jgi:hypothetical protein
MNRTKPGKAYWAMTAQELVEATKQFDKPLLASHHRPATKAERARFERALRAGAMVHRFDELGLDPELLSSAAAYAKRRKIPLGRLVERGLRRELAVKD